MKRVWEVFGLLLLAAVAAILGGILVAALRADGKPDYCYMKASWHNDGTAVQTMLYTHRPWREDARIQTVKDAEEAARVAQAIGCPLR